MCTCNQLSKRSRHAVSLQEYKIYISLTHMALCMYTCSCMPTTLSPSPDLSSLAHSNRTPQRMHASVPRCMPIARLGLIHHTMPLPYPNTLLQKPCQCVGVWCNMRVYVRVTKGGLKACVCLFGVNARIYNNGG